MVPMRYQYWLKAVDGSILTGHGAAQHGAVQRKHKDEEGGYPPVLPIPAHTGLHGDLVSATDVLW